MATSVGSKALTIKQAIIVAAIFEFAGALLAGGQVTKTIRKGMVDAELLSGTPELLVYGMLASLLAGYCIFLRLAGVYNTFYRRCYCRFRRCGHWDGCGALGESRLHRDELGCVASAFGCDRLFIIYQCSTFNLEKSVDPRARAQLLDSLGYMIKI